jgi:hypothetical protein
LNQNHQTKRDNGMFKATWHCCMFCNPAKGQVYFEDGWFFKLSFTTDYEVNAYLLNKPKVKYVKLKNKNQ